MGERTMFTRGPVPHACPQHNSVSCECSRRLLIEAWADAELDAELRAWERASDEVFRRIDEWEAGHG